ncbi:MAG: anthranilate phosphoribosyltransferase, partial [Thermoleophilia bacterium]|nr:anthranilate phosphoribosyltransferase [Thermoleophilia bacterium]
VRIDLDPPQVAACLRKVGMAFMFAPLHHTATGRVAGVRRALGVRTVFNFLGPLTNPAGVRRLLVGVSLPNYLEVLAQALARLGCSRALLVHGHDGLDELSVMGPSTVVEVEDGQVKAAADWEPELFGLGRWTLADLAGGDAATNAALTRAVLAGEKGARRDVTLLNAGAALYLADAVTSVSEGVQLAARVIDEGRALQVLEQMVAFTNEVRSRSWEGGL